MRGDSGGNLGMALHAFERRLPSKLVATGAVSCTVQGLVGPRKWAGRNLAGSWRCRQKQEQNKEQKCGKTRSVLAVEQKHALALAKARNGWELSPQ